MRSYFKSCKNINQVNNFLKKYNLDGFSLDADYVKTGYWINNNNELQYDQWISENKGVSISIFGEEYGYDVSIIKYNKVDLNKEN